MEPDGRHQKLRKETEEHKQLAALKQCSPNSWVRSLGIKYRWNFGEGGIEDGSPITNVGDDEEGGCRNERNRRDSYQRPAVLTP